MGSSQGYREPPGTEVRFLGHGDHEFLQVAGSTMRHGVLWSPLPKTRPQVPSSLEVPLPEPVHPARGNPKNSCSLPHRMAGKKGDHNLNWCLRVSRSLQLLIQCHRVGVPPFWVWWFCHTDNTEGIPTLGKTSFNLLKYCERNSGLSTLGNTFLIDTHEPSGYN